MVARHGRGVFTDPSKVHRIEHDGEYFKVPGIHLCEPSPQRTPVIYQAGASSRGRAFAAETRRGDLHRRTHQGAGQGHRGHDPPAAAEPGVIPTRSGSSPC